MCQNLADVICERSHKFVNEPSPENKARYDKNNEFCAKHIGIKSRANILTRVQSKAYTEPSSFSSLFNLPFSKDIHYFSQARHIAHSTT